MATMRKGFESPDSRVEEKIQHHLDTSTAARWGSAEDIDAARRAGRLTRTTDLLEKLVADLGSDDFDTREQAMKVLRSSKDPRKLDALWAAEKSPDPHVRRLAGELLLEMRDVELEKAYDKWFADLIACEFLPKDDRSKRLLRTDVEKIRDIYEIFGSEPSHTDVSSALEGAVTKYRRWAGEGPYWKCVERQNNDNGWCTDWRSTSALDSRSFSLYFNFQDSPFMGKRGLFVWFPMSFEAQRRIETPADILPE